MGEAWHTALRVVARHKPLAFWRTTYGAAFWWCPGEAELLPGRFATQPFTYAEVASVIAPAGRGAQSKGDEVRGNEKGQ